jgi:G-rich domain on putative tyrosine kinase
MTVLERNSNMNEQIFRFLHEKRTDAEIAKAANISFHRIISRGEVSKSPVSPNPGLIKTVAGFLGFMGSVLLIFLVHAFKARINNEGNIQKNSDTVVFQRIPYLKNKTVANNAFEKIAIDLQVKQFLEKGSVIVFSSFDDKEGKKTIAMGMVQGAVALGKKILLVDVDGKITAAKPQGADFISLSAMAENWKQVDKLKSLFKEWKEKYDVVVIKNSSIAKDPSSLLLMSEATLNLLIVDARRTKMKRIEDTDLLKIELGLANTQFVLNRNGYTPSLFSEGYRIVRSVSLKKPFIKFKR